MQRFRLLVMVPALVVSAGVPVGAGSGQPPPTIPERARGAERVVVATVANTTARYERNRFGDELIVTYAQLAVEEAIKGSQGPAVLAIEGGTVNGMTMRVSDLPAMSTGERAVFFLTPRPDGSYTPHLRGQGVLKIDRANRVQGSSLTVDEIRRLTRGRE